MDKKLLTLTKILLKSGSNPGGKGKKGRTQLAIGILLAVCFLPLVINIGFFASMAYDVLSALGQQGVILSLAVAATAFVTFFFGIFYTMGTFYFSNDIESLLHLPVRPSQILSAKFIVVTVYEYLTEVVILLPVMTVYGVKSGGGPAFWIYGLLVFLTLPVIPLVISSAITMVVMRFTNVVRNKDRFRMVAGIIAMSIGLGVNVVIQRSVSSLSNQDQLYKMLTQGNNSLVGLTSRLFPGSGFAAMGLVDCRSLNGLVNILLFAAVTVLAYAVFLYIGKLLYFKGVIGISETFSRRRKISSSELDKSTVHSPVLNAYVMKELKILFRTPAYFMNCILMNFIWPLFIIILPLTNSRRNSLAFIEQFLRESGASGLAVVIAFAIFMFVSSTNGVTASAISREGQGLFVNKYLPVSYKDQILAKVLSGIIIGGIGMLSVSALLSVGVITFKAPVYLIFLALLVGFLAIVFTSFLGIIFDLFNPKLNWDNEQKAVKQNLNLVFNMLICSGLAGLVILAEVKLQLSLPAVLAGILVIFGLLTGLLYFFLMTKGVKLFRKLED